MKQALIVHNPNAGSKTYSKEEIATLLQARGFQCRYSSTKFKIKDIKDDTGLIVIAGGDGTVRKVITRLMDSGAWVQNIPLLLLPLGTANNISKSFGIPENVHSAIGLLDEQRLQHTDAGLLKGLSQPVHFIESCGFGVFPELMKKMKKKPKIKASGPDEEMKTALKRLQKIILTCHPPAISISIGSHHFQGNFLMAEVMNISFIGPNLLLSPGSDQADGLFELVLIPESRRDAFAGFIEDKIQGKDDPFPAEIMKGQNISISSSIDVLHVDDKRLSGEHPVTLSASVQRGVLSFYIP